MSLVPWRVNAIAGGAVLVIGLGGGWGARDLVAQAAAGKVAKAALEASESARKADYDQTLATLQLGMEYGAKQSKTDTIYRNIIQQVPTYVSPQADAAAIIPAGFVRLHDAAAAGLDPVPDPAGQSNDSASGVALSTVASTVATNYGICNDTRDRLIGLQGWVSSLAKPPPK